MSGTLKPPAVDGTLELGRRRYRYSAEIEFKVDVIWHQRPKGRPEPVKAPVKRNEPVFFDSTEHTSRWDQTVAQKGIVLAVVTFVLYTASRAVEIFAAKGMVRPTIMPPLIHQIDHRNFTKDA